MKAQDILPDGQNQLEIDGIVIRKGSVGAFLANARVWCDAAADSARRADAEADILQALPALRQLRLFEVLSVRDEALRRLVEAH
ncbi:hypothetical protein [Pseudorhodoferax sp.]|uniref:hypothetical protein n=1 Tax=Pseudorhodoferax sp. TaxID=1993553 RepID=UPI002DD6717A|nr:hypothetical protein [Pseudorhodoferax sp.]